MGNPDDWDGLVGEILAPLCILAGLAAIVALAFALGWAIWKGLGGS